jgi:hypothetical protein
MTDFGRHFAKSYSTGFVTTGDAAIGGATLANGTSYTITHGLNSTDLIFQLYATESNPTTNLGQIIQVYSEYMGSDNPACGGGGSCNQFGYQIIGMTANTVTLHLGAAGYRKFHNNTIYNWPNIWIKLVIIAHGGLTGHSSDHFS